LLSGGSPLFLQYFALNTYNDVFYGDFSAGSLSGLLG
jgi:hypothetical protein